MKSKAISVIIPCFNEESTLTAVLHDLDKELRRIGVNYEIIVIDDGSTDTTLDVINNSTIKVKALHHRSNRGYGASIKTGINAASNEYIVLMDADGQHPPSNIEVLLKDMGDCDMVIGSRRQQASHHWRMPGKKMLTLICQFLVGRKLPDINSGFRIFRRSVIKQYMHLCSDQFSFSTSSTLAMLSDHLNVSFVPIDISPRLGGKSRVRISTGFATLMLIFRIIGTFNPLKIFMPPALLCLFLGSILLVWGVLARNITDITVILLFMGLLLFCFGLLADQIALIRKEIHKS